MSDVIVKSHGIEAYSQFRAQLAELKAENASLVFDYADPQGNKAARSQIYTLRQTKAAVERVRKDEKQASLDYGRRIDGEAKEIVSEIDDMIDVHARPIREIDEREEKRVSAIKRRLEEIELTGTTARDGWLDRPLDGLRLMHDEIDDGLGWDEFADLAKERIAAARALIRAAIDRREKHDADQSELAKLREAQAAQAQKERDERIAREAVERASKEAECKMQAERDAATRREVEAEIARKVEAHLAEQREQKLILEKAAAEQRATDAEMAAVKKAALEAEAKAQAEKLAAEKREANKRNKAKIEKEAMDGLIAAGIDDAAAAFVVGLIAAKSIPHVTITY